MTRRAWVSIAAIVCGTISGHAALTVRVESPNGAPRLVVNGEPVRARMFFGGPGAGALKVSPEWREVRFEFTAVAGASNGTMHFRFGHAPGDVFLDDIHVRDLDEKRDVIPNCSFESADSFRRDWTFWPTGEQNTVGKIEVAPGKGRGGTGALHVQLKAPAGGKWPDFHIYHQPRLKITAEHRHSVSFWVRAEPAREVTVAFYQPGETFTRLGGPADCFEQQIKLAAEAGINFVSFPISLPWPKPGTAVNWSSVDVACETVLRANPQALLLPRMGMDPPDWWRAAHPEDVMQWEDGRRDRAVVASPVYRREAAARLAELVRHLENKFGEHVAGYHPCGQNTGEWFYEATWDKPLNGYAPADLAGWRQWLKKRYASDAALQKAWDNADVSLENAKAPTAVERHAAPAGIFRDPVKERALIDWAEFQQEAMAECVCDLARAARQASAGRKLVLFFYGYVFEFAPVQNGPATAGHYALRRVLESPDIDVLCSPISYFDRGLGQNAPAMTAAESVALAGKMWLNEDDTHTYLATGDPPGSKDHVTTIEDTNRELARNVAQEACRNFATWWMDLLATGWFNDPAMWAEMKRLKAFDEAFLKNPTPYRPEVAAVIDEASMLRVAAGGNAVTSPGIYEARAALGRMGAPYGQYLLDDVLAGRVQAKVYVFLNAWCLTARQRAQLSMARYGSTAVWCYAPGYFEGAGTSLEAMRELTGFTFKKVKPVAKASPTTAGKRLGLQREFGLGRTVAPLFAVENAKPEEVLAVYPDGSSAVVLRRSNNPEEVLSKYPDGSSAVAVRRGAHGVSMFVGAPELTSELLRAACRAGGAHLFTETDCNVYASGEFLALHASQEGPVVLETGRSKPVTDMLTGAVVGVGPQLKLSLKRGETRVLRIGAP